MPRVYRGFLNDPSLPYVSFCSPFMVISSALFLSVAPRLGLRAVLCAASHPGSWLLAFPFSLLGKLNESRDYAHLYCYILVRAPLALSPHFQKSLLTLSSVVYESIRFIKLPLLPRVATSRDIF
jgi:hypothetical protein